MNTVNRPVTGFARAVGTSPMEGHYDGKELAAAPARATATTTHEYPTRVGNRLHYRDGTVTQLDGSAISADAPHAPPAQALTLSFLDGTTKVIDTTDAPPKKRPKPLKPVAAPTPATAPPEADTTDFAAALWHDGELELYNLPVEDDGYVRLNATQTDQLARLLAGRAKN